MDTIQTTLGSLPCHIVQPHSQAQAELAVVLCHGFGAPGTDLVPLALEIARQRPELAPRVRFVFPEAPLAMPELGFSQARAWWPLDVERFSAAARDPQARRELQTETPKGLPRSRRLLTALLDELARRSGLPLSRIVLGGFSQGAMLATDVSLRLQEAPAGLVILSGTLLCEAEWRSRAPIRRGLPVFQTHGTYDPLLPFDRAEALRDLLAAAGLRVEFLPFAGMHTIPAEALVGLISFIAQRLGGAAPSSGSVA